RLSASFRHGLIGKPVQFRHGPATVNRYEAHCMPLSFVKPALCLTLKVLAGKGNAKMGRRAESATWSQETCLWESRDGPSRKGYVLLKELCCGQAGWLVPYMDLLVDVARS